MVNIWIIVPIIIIVLFLYKRTFFAYLVIGIVFALNYFNIKKAFINKDKKKSLKLMRKFVNIFLSVCGTKLKLENKDLLNKDFNDNVMIIGNHTSNLDIMNLILNLERDFFPVSKIELIKVPIIKMLLDPFETLYIERDNMRQSFKIIIEATKLISPSKAFIVFPEGTRNEIFKELKPGSFTPISKKGGYVIITKNYNLRECLETRKPFAINKTGHTKVLDAVYFKPGTKTTEIAQICTDILIKN